jgi:hypothetical protein
MLPLAEVIHHGVSRLRLRIATHRGQPEFFQRVVEGLVTLEGLDRIEANPDTGSILIMPGIDPARVAAHAESAGLFRLGSASVTVRPITEGLAAGFRDANNALKSISGGRVDLASTAFVALVGAAAVQLRSGHVLGPASTLLWYAAGLLLATEVARAAKSGASS